jgi:arginase
MPTIRLIAWPYHAGLRDVGVGLGAAALARDDGLRAALEQPGHRVAGETVPPVDETLPEAARIFELDRRLARQVAAACADGAFPLVLAGNCCSCLGTVAGARAPAAVWLDAHADFDTPEDNLSGLTDVMGLAILTGSGWRALRETIPGFAPLCEADVVLAGVRDLAPYQRERLAGSAVRTVPGAIDRDALLAALDRLHESQTRTYLHVDLDVLDAGVGRANPHAAAGGPPLDAVLAAVDAVFDRFEVAAAALASYDPSTDRDGAVASAARAIAARIAQRLTPPAARYINAR